MSVEERLAGLESTYGQVSARLDSIDQRIGGIADRLAASIAELRRDTNAGFATLRTEMATSIAAVHARIDALDGRLTGAITALGQETDRKITALDERLTGAITALKDETSQRMSALDQKYDSPEERMQRQFHWLLGAIGGSFGLLFSTIVTVMIRGG